MNWDNVAKWFYGLVSAFIGAASSAVTASIVAPESFNLSHAGLLKIGELCVVSGGVAVAMYLKQSPLPPLTTSTTVTTTISSTVPQAGVESATKAP